MNLIESVDDRKKISAIFSGIEDSMMIAYLQGYQGNGFVNDIDNPTVGLIVSGEYSFYGGDANSPDAVEMVRRLFDFIEGDETVGIFADHNQAWKDRLLACDVNRPIAVPRFGIAQRDYDFDIDMLSAITKKVPSGLELKQFDKTLYEQAISEAWSREFCETFESASDYLRKGFGYAITDGGLLVSGTSTMTVYDGGTEIQVATRESHRKQGLAIITSAAFILECVRRGIRPCWDAANEASLHMAIKLGYEYKGEYTTIKMTRPE